MKRFKRAVAVILSSATLFTAVTHLAFASDTRNEDQLKTIYGDEYLIWTNESGENRTNACELPIKWTSTNNIAPEAVDSGDVNHGNIMKVPGSKASKAATHSTSTISNDGWQDISQYKYLSFRYKKEQGNGTLTVALKHDSETVASLIVDLGTVNDEKWHEAIVEIAEGNAQKKLSGINVNLTDQTNSIVYFDDVALSVKSPEFTDEESQETETPTPTDDPTKPPVQEKSDLNDIYGDTFIVQTNEDGESRGGACIDFGTWESNKMEMGRDKDPEHGQVRLAKCSDLNINYKRYQITNEAWKDLSAYHYLSFWYKGDGTENTLTFVFRKDGTSNPSGVIKTIDVSIPSDTDWHFYSASIDDWTKKPVEYMNIKLANTGTVYFDDMAFSAKEPDVSGKPHTPEPITQEAEEKTIDGDSTIKGFTADYNFTEGNEYSEVGMEITASNGQGDTQTQKVSVDITGGLTGDVRWGVIVKNIPEGFDVKAKFYVE